jgi:uncharacterized protein
VKVDPTMDRPLPQLTDAPSREYFTAWKDGRLLVQRCPDCGHRQHYPKAMCEECGGTPVFEQEQPVGTVYTFTVIRQMAGEPFRTEAPYPVAMIELDCGVKIMGTVTDCEPEDVHIGMRVTGYPVVYGEIGVPFWRPVGSGS